MRRLERAEVVWLLAQARPRSPRDSQSLVEGEALLLSQAAHHDDATLAHALDLGRATVRRQPGDEVAMGGVRLLEQAIAFSV